MKPIRVEVKLKNNLLYTLRVKAGMSTHEMAEAIPMAYQCYLQMENLLRSPLDRFGAWNNRAQRLSTYWGMSPEELFPQAVCRVRKREGAFEMDERQIDRLLASPRASLPVLPEEIPERAVFAGELRPRVEGLFARYVAAARNQKARETHVRMWKLHYGWEDGVEHTFVEIAALTDRDKQRVCQVVDMLNRRLRLDPSVRAFGE